MCILIQVISSKGENISWKGTTMETFFGLVIMGKVASSFQYNYTWFFCRHWCLIWILLFGPRSCNKFQIITQFPRRLNVETQFKILENSGVNFIKKEIPLFCGSRIISVLSLSHKNINLFYFWTSSRNFAII